MNISRQLIALVQITKGNELNKEYSHKCKIIHKTCPI